MAPALAVLAKYEVYTVLVNTPFANLPEWIGRWNAVDPSLLSVVDINKDGILQLAEISIGGDIIVLATPEIGGLPYVVSGMVAAGGLAAALSTADGLLLTIANALSHDLYYKVLDPNASTARRVTVSKALLLVVALCAAYVAAQKPADILFLVSAAFSFAAAAFFPALTLGIFWKRANKWGASLGMVSERDLFAMQKQSLKSVSSSLRAATDSASLIQAAAGIRRLAHSLLGQGVQARQLTAMISHLNDVLTEKLLALKAEEHGIDMRRLCWLALGSEGRDEQTIATDQDNALILPNDTTEAQRAKTLAFARDVNLVLDACGYPLCRGGVMAGEPACCLTWNEWRARFEQWVRQGTPEDLLNASIYFDFRYLSGDAMLAQSLRQEVVQAAQQIPRFLKQMALNALTRGVALNWRGAIDTDTNGALDLKLQGAAIFVDVARIYSLAHGLAQTNTRQRLEAAGQHMALAENEYGAWVSGFEFLQMLRLRIQLQGGPALAQPNRLVIAELNDIDRRILRETLRVARQLQQRLQLDYQR